MKDLDFFLHPERMKENSTNTPRDPIVSPSASSPDICGGSGSARLKRCLDPPVFFAARPVYAVCVTTANFSPLSSVWRTSVRFPRFSMAVYSQWMPKTHQLRAAACGRRLYTRISFRIPVPSVFSPKPLDQALAGANEPLVWLVGAKPADGLVQAHSRLISIALSIEHCPAGCSSPPCVGMSPPSTMVIFLRNGSSSRSLPKTPHSPANAF